jgi:ATP-binding cassette subfamily B protein RaxB
MNALADEFNAQFRVSRLTVSYQTVGTALFSIERVLVVWLAALAVLDNRLSVGMLFAFLSYRDQFSQRAGPLIDKLFEARMLRIHGERVADIVLAEPEVDSQEIELDISAVQSSIEVRGLSFRYADTEPFVLSSLDLVIEPGQCVAITGPSGCGKTTLVKLLVGLLRPTAGEILVGGMPLRHFGLTNYRHILGTVMQNEYLFAGSIGDNICFADPLPDQRRIEECGKLASVHDEIIAMPMGYNTLIGDVGSGLSGGQKQRILLARALYRQPRILILDEATSHLDVANESQVNAAIKGMAMTRIVIAHRPETIAMADRVVVIENGKVVRDLAQSPRSPLGLGR